MTATVSHFALVLDAVLFASIWQGALITGVAWLALRCLPRLGAASRHAIWLCTLAALVAIPSFTVLMVQGRSASQTARTVAKVSQPTEMAGAKQVDPAPQVRNQLSAAAHETLAAEPAQIATGPRSSS